MAEEKKEEQQQAPPPDPAKKAKVLTIAFAVLNFVVLGGGAYMVYTSTIGHEPLKITEEVEQETLKKSREIASEAPISYTMEPYVVNLDGFPRRSIRVSMTLEMMDEQGFEEVVTLGSVVRDQIVNVLNSKKFTELDSIQGKLTLKTQIITLMNKQLEKGIVKDVYFNDFIVQ